ncbi:MobF family relaxase [Rubrimonas cliftonensis]|uniref:Conjugative relaxase domain-containing protein, TrwC/TraI family n=1 Tax=Rubrimonas cliftonensis TaxID=89524 RepID=A0A1H4FWC6_9RHOB|nr:MobF family relaxase [Rubrimonas cliftonensis]SEB01150.1 conjugative relaxase domain-containing protein, TrwC/TraI family [Rubrimonas cliftonensis]
MLSIGAVTSAAGASGYFNRDDYYTRDADSPSAWWGAGAERLGLAGRVERGAFEAVLEGRLPGVHERLGFAQQGAWKHKAGWDLTFSAPKSVSILAEVAGDTRLLAAHDAAVKAALETVERDLAATRVKNDGRIVREPTGALVVALFRHDLSRNRDPQLHTHAVVANATPTERGWRSIDSRALYDAKMAIGLRYRQELALRVQRLGYAIDVTPNGGFEIRGVTSQTIAAFSTRRAEIEARLDALGKGDGLGTAKDADAATLATRRAKSAGERTAEPQRWRARLDGRALGALDGLRAAAERAGPKAARSHEGAARTVAAADVLREATAALAERDAAFSVDRLMGLAGKIAVGRATDADLAGALTDAMSRGGALARRVVEADRLARVDMEKEGLTTEALRAEERALIAAEAAGRGAVARLASPQLAGRAIARAAASAKEPRHAWTEDQRAATIALLTTRNSVVAVQGLAGTAKTSTVLATYAAEARRLGKDLHALAPTASAAETLAQALGLEGRTVDRHLAELKSGVTRPIQNRWGYAEPIWIVDEASMLSTAKLRSLLDAATAQKARVVLVGDVRQLGSVEAGAAFRQMQEAGMQTAVLERIVRQTDAALRQAVEQAATGDAARATGYFAGGGGALIVDKDADARLTALASAWLALSPAERAATILIEPSRAGRARINAAIREGLAAEGTLSGPALAAPRLESKGLTTVEKRFVFSYAPGDTVRFQRGYRFDGVAVAKDDYLTVVEVRQGDGVVALRTPADATVLWRPAEKGAAKAEVFARETGELRAGDRIVWTRNDARLGLRNGLEGRVVEVDPAARTAAIAFADKRVRVIGMDAADAGHWRHGYAQTAHSAQGRTAERVLIHAESHRINLINASSFYVALSRARANGALVTDDLAELRKALAGRAGVKMSALDASEAARVADQTVARELGVAARLAERLSEALRSLRVEPRRAEPALDSAAALFAGRTPEPTAKRVPERSENATRLRPEPSRPRERDRDAARRPESLDAVLQAAEERRRVDAARAPRRPSQDRGLER